EWGISLLLSPPQRKEIAKILERKAINYQCALSARAIDFLAESFATNSKSAVKALEALMLRTHISKNGQKANIAVSEIKSLLSDLIEAEKATALSPLRIISQVAEHYAIPTAELIGKSQSRDCVVPRKLAMYLCRLLLKTPYMKIGDL